MAKKATKKKAAAHVVGPDEEKALAKRASLRRALAIERTVKALMRSLTKLRQRNALDLVSLAAFLANEAGYQLTKPQPEA